MMIRSVVIIGLALFCLVGLIQAHAEEGCACGRTDPANSCMGNSVAYERAGRSISFEFNCDGGACACGQFATGWDYWVAPLSAGGAVEITRMTPDAIAPGTSDLRHGAQVDPQRRAGQGLTSLEPSGVNRMEPLDLSQSVQVPLRFSATALDRTRTVLKAIDHELRCTNSDRQCLEYVESLTVLSEPPGDVFRPPYFGTEKTLYRAEDLDTSLLTSLPPLGSTMSWDDALDVLRSPHLVHNRRGRQQGMTAAVNQQVTRGYDQFPNTELNRALLKLVEAVEGADVARKEQLARYVVQQGIDRYYIHKAPLNAGICGAWEGAGGFNGGNLLPIILAAVMLGRDDWLDTVNENLATRDGLQCFAETGFIQRNSERRGKGIPTFGHLNTSIYSRIGNCNHANRNCASVGGRDQAEYEFYDGLADGDPLGASGSPTAYQQCCTHGNWLGAALAAWLTPAVRDAFPNNARHFLDYMELRKRRGDEIGFQFASFSNPENDDVTGFNSSYGHSHFLAMWDAYKDCFADSSCPGMEPADRPLPPVLFGLP